MDVTLALLGILAGLLTTLAGLGGGVLLILALSLLHGPHLALVLTAPALLLGNVHRSFLCRREIDRSIAKRLIVGTLPGSVAGGLLAGAAPPWVLNALLLGITAFAVVRALGWVRASVPVRALAPAGAVIGGLAGTGGGAGMLLAPVILSTGLTGSAYVGTAAAVAVSMHVGRVLAYGSTGLFTPELVWPTATLTAAIFLGNFLGDWVRPRLPSRAHGVLEYGVLVGCVGLAVSGVAR